MGLLKNKYDSISNLHDIVHYNDEHGIKYDTVNKLVNEFMDCLINTFQYCIGNLIPFYGEEKFNENDYYKFFYEIQKDLFYSKDLEDMLWSILSYFVGVDDERIKYFDKYYKEYEWYINDDSFSESSESCYDYDSQDSNFESNGWTCPKCYLSYYEYPCVEFKLCSVCDDCYYEQATDEFICNKCNKVKRNKLNDKSLKEKDFCKCKDEINQHEYEIKPSIGHPKYYVDGISFDHDHDPHECEYCNFVTPKEECEICKNKKVHFNLNKEDQVKKYFNRFKNNIVFQLECMNCNCVINFVRVDQICKVKCTKCEKYLCYNNVKYLCIQCEDEDNFYKSFPVGCNLLIECNKCKKRKYIMKEWINISYCDKCNNLLESKNIKIINFDAHKYKQIGKYYITDGKKYLHPHDPHNCIDCDEYIKVSECKLCNNRRY